MTYDPYSRLNQQLLDGAIVACSFYLAFLIRYDWALPPHNEYQFLGFIALIAAAQLLTNLVFGLHLIQWRYIALRVTFRVSESFVSFLCFLLLSCISYLLQKAI